MKKKLPQFMDSQCGQVEKNIIELYTTEHWIRRFINSGEYKKEHRL